jgi:hypothetical protein
MSAHHVPPSLLTGPLALISNKAVEVQGATFESIEEIHAESQNMMMMQNDFSQCF